MRHGFKFGDAGPVFSYFLTKNVASSASDFFRSISFLESMGIHQGSPAKLCLAKIVGGHHASGIHKIIQCTGAKAGYSEFSKKNR